MAASQDRVVKLERTTIESKTARLPGKDIAEILW
jgi:hypothetical protein